MSASGDGMGVRDPKGEEKARGVSGAVKGATALVAVALVGLAVVFLGGGESAPRDESTEASGIGTSASPAAADRHVASLAEERLRSFRAGEAGRLALDAVELTALLRHTLPGLVPRGVTEPVVVLEDGHVRLSARVSSAVYPGVDQLARVLSVLPDTIAVTLGGTLERRGDELHFAIEEAWAEQLPLPRPIVAALVEQLPFAVTGDAGAEGREGERGAPRLRLAWPTGVSAMAVQGSWLVLEADEPIPVAAVDGSGGAKAP